MPKPTHYGIQLVLYAKPWTRNIALLRYQLTNLRDSYAADKRCYNVFFNMSYRPARLPVINGFGGLNDTAKVLLFSGLAKFFCKITHNYPEI